MWAGSSPSLSPWVTSNSCRSTTGHGHIHTGLCGMATVGLNSIPQRPNCLAQESPTHPKLTVWPCPCSQQTCRTFLAGFSELWTLTKAMTNIAAFSPSVTACTSPLTNTGTSPPASSPLFNPRSLTT
ncbi:hypothetical protein DPEC_G00022790 [Dallia pectoralis]|uniref:Uncharacterized protein n=1 Tax=Dallia pectoralis TaxID=75939 RepID=A0ACC2HGJ9_DALPE|nr:hypothetical protein DPEC_G00022790 [Dallia pectoralis]